MKEDFLHFLWKFKLFNALELKTTEGESISVIKNGIHNHNSGPDFLNTQLKIGDKTWSGNVEIHLKSSDWLAHKHQYDEAYKNVILHVVYQHDKDIYLTQKGDLPVLELKNHIKKQQLDSYLNLNNSRDWIPCYSQFPQVESIKIEQYVDRLVVNRLQRKSTEIIQLLIANKLDWNETFYQWLAKCYGFKLNSEAFLSLATKLPVKILKKHANSLFQTEALIFGVAGFLHEEKELEYHKKLRYEYLFLKKKYSLVEMNSASWKFSKTYPSNFPTVRLAQFAQFISSESGTFSKLLEVENYKKLKEDLMAPMSDYWKSHYHFEHTAKNKLSAKMGLGSAENLVINAVAPTLFAYGLKEEKEDYTYKAVDCLEDISAESNSIITKWKKLGLTIHNAKHSQAVIELKREKCERKKCLTCLFGVELIKQY